MSNKLPGAKAELLQQTDNDDRKKSLAQHVSLSPFAAPSWGNGHGSQKSNIRIVARIRPLRVDEVQEENSTVVFSKSIHEINEQNISTIDSPISSLKEGCSVAGLAAKFNSPLSKPLTPVQSQMKSFSPSKRLYHGKISNVHSIQSPSNQMVPSKLTVSSANLGNMTNKLTVGLSNPVEFDYDAVSNSFFLAG